MFFEPFFEKFPEIAAQETRNVTVARSGDLPGTYYFADCFCTDKGCDCRRALIQVYSGEQTRKKDLGQPLAVISYGWEKKAFYRAWASFPLTKDDLHELMGPALARMAIQSEIAPTLLQLFKEQLRDPEYRARIVQHYEMYRAMRDGHNHPRRDRMRLGSQPGRGSTADRTALASPSPREAVESGSEKANELKNPTPTSSRSRPGRNDPCWCGTGKKYKKCHLPRGE